MDTLRELGEFVGMGDATPTAITGPSIRTPTTVQAIGERLSPFVTAGERTSLRAMIQALPRLPPISLEVESTGTLAGEVPISVNFTVRPSNGVILSTAVRVFEEGRLQGSPLVLLGPEFSTASARVSEPSPGSFAVIVSRVGVPSTGVTVLEKTFNIFARAKPAPKPPKTERDPPPEGKKPTTPTLHSKVVIFNCHDGKRTLDIRARDLTQGTDYKPVANLEAQYDESGVCPARDATPVEISLTDKHWHEIVALDSEMPGCRFSPDDPVDPLNANCWREHIVILGDKNGPVFQAIVS